MSKRCTNSTCTQKQRICLNRWRVWVLFQRLFPCPMMWPSGWAFFHLKSSWGVGSKQPSTTCLALVELTTHLDFSKERHSQLMGQLHNIDLNYKLNYSRTPLPSWPLWCTSSSCFFFLFLFLSLWFYMF